MLSTNKERVWMNSHEFWEKIDMNLSGISLLRCLIQDKIKGFQKVQFLEKYTFYVYKLTDQILAIKHDAVSSVFTN